MMDRPYSATAATLNLLTASSAMSATQFIAVLFGVSLLIPLTGSAQTPLSFYDYVRGDLEWQSIETEHFKVLYHSPEDGSIPWTAREVARQAENVYEPITELYGHEPEGKTSFIIRDFEDYSNGAAYFFDNVIVLWAPALNSPLRGQHEWIRNVVAHEFTHIVQVQATMKSARQRPFFYFQSLSYEDTRRPDVLYGYPNVIITYPVPSISNPAWFAEGTAQFQRSNLHLDTWDTHRDMLLRMRVLSGDLLSLADMGGFYSHSSLERETVYNQGFAFSLYLANRFGEQVLADISTALSRWKNYSIERAIEAATGVPANDIYSDWADSLKDHYSDVVASIGDTTTFRTIGKEGFFNFHPHVSPDGSRIAYLTNGSSSEGTTHLAVQDLNAGDDGHRASALLSIEVGSFVGHTCSFGHTLVPAVTGDFSWHPDGSRIVYSKRKDTSEGYLFADLYVVDIESGKSSRLTTHARAMDPAYNSDGSLVTFVSQEDGTTNIGLLHVESGDISLLTNFPSGTQVSEPVFNGDTILFTRSGSSGNGIYQVEVESGAVTVVVDTEADERSPSTTDKGSLLFASDRTGIFNIYERNAQGTVKQLTNVAGGAFMPSAAADSFSFAVYGESGYRVAMSSSAAMTHGERVHVAGPAILEKNAPRQGLANMESPAIETNTYRSDFTSFSFYPVLRFDQYVSRERRRPGENIAKRGRLETLGRNTKVGMYVSSREILNELAFTGGIMIGPGSRAADSFGDYVAPASLLKLERDLFVSFDYRKGIIFRGKRWSPQLAIEMYNIRRNVEDGLTIEEFSCTACFPPDTTFADISYNLWQLNLTARSKINRYLLAEVAYRYSPYRVTTERFFSTEFQESIAESSSRYFIGKAVTGRVRSEILARHRHADVFEDGLKMQLDFETESGRLLDRFDVEDGVLAPVYENDRVHRVTIDTYFGKRLPGNPLRAMHGASVRLRLSTILGSEVDSFYNDYAGGLVGARGYPFYALGGNETAWLQLSYTVPLFPSIHRQIGFVYLDKVFLRGYFDFANAWSGSIPSLSDAKKDVGAEIRVVTGSFYILPSAFFVSGTYGLDEFEFKLDESFVAPGGNETVSYGKSFQVHAGLLFSFDF